MRRHSRNYYIRTAGTFQKRRYLLVKRILPETILQYLKVYYEILTANNRFSNDGQCPSSLSVGGDAALDAVLEWIRPEVSRLVGINLAPTYSYTRQYAKDEVLTRHRDRPSCEISVTVSIQVPKGAGPSVLHLKPPNLEETKVEMLEGDGCVYAGTEIEHWRERFSVDGYIQLFLHFVDKGGPNYPKLMFDGRECLGAKYPDGKPCTMDHDAVNAVLLKEFLKERRTVQELKKEIAALTESMKKEGSRIQKVGDQLPSTKSPQEIVLNSQ